MLRREESAVERSIRRGPDTNCGEHLGNTRGSRLERPERMPRDLSLIGGARPADWLTSKSLPHRDTLVSRRFTIRVHDEHRAEHRRSSRVTDEPLGPRPDWQRNRTGIDLRRSISSPEEIRDRSNRHTELNIAYSIVARGSNEPPIRSQDTQRYSAFH